MLLKMQNVILFPFSLSSILLWIYICIYRSHFFHLFICWWTLRLIPYLGNYKCCYKHWSTCIFSNYCFLFLSDIYPGVEFLDQRVVLFLIFWETSILFSILTAPIPILINSVWGFPCLHLIPTIVICVLFDDSHSDWCEVVSCGFDLHFTDD